MVRPIKRGFDYYSHYTNTFLDIKIRKLIRLHQGNGYLLYNYILNEIFRTEGYFMLYDNDIKSDIANTFYCLDESLIEEIVKYLLDEGLFNREVFNNYSIFTSEYVQLIYEKLRASLTRKPLFIELKYYLLDGSYKEYISGKKKPDDNPDNTSSNSINPEKTDDNSRKTLLSPPKKQGREGKEIERKENEISLFNIETNFNSFLEIFLIEKNHSINELKKFINHYESNGWKNGNVIANVMALARKWENRSGEKFLKPDLHIGWKNVWKYLVDDIGYEEAKPFLKMVPVLINNEITFYCTKEIHNYYLDNSKPFYKAISNHFGNGMKIKFSKMKDLKDDILPNLNNRIQ